MRKRKKPTKTSVALERAGREIKENPPRVLASTARKFGPERAEKQRVAILLSKARQAGARIPQKPESKMSDKELDGAMKRGRKFRW